MGLLFLLSLPFIGILLHFKRLRIILAIAYFSIFIIYPCYKEMHHGLIPIVRIAYVAGIVALYQWNVPIMIAITKSVILKTNDKSTDKNFESPFFFLVAILDIMFVIAVLAYLEKLGSISVIGHKILSFLLGNTGFILCIIAFIIYIEWLSNQTKKKEINKNEGNSIPHNANCWTEEELNAIYRVRFLREQRERYEKEKNDTKE